MGIPLRVLIIEDSAEDAELEARELVRGGYDPTWERVDTSAAMEGALDKETWDAIIADYSMPQFSAPAALKLLQSRGLDLPFIVVSGTIGEDVAVEMMKAGAHDYIMKDNLTRLVSAVEREIREAKGRRARWRAEEELRQYRDHLEELVEQRTRDLKETQEKLAESEQRAVLGQFVGSVAHEIRNPLGVIAGSAYYLRKVIKEDDEKVHTHLGNIMVHSEACSKIIESLLNITQIKSPKLTPLDLIAEVCTEIKTVDVPSNIAIEWTLPEAPIPILADKAQIMVALKNIITNAVQAMPDGGALSMAVDTLRTEEKNWAEIRISDTGPGIAPEDTDRIFQPLFSTKIKGIGFGLPIVEMIVVKHKGHVFVESEAGEGATFVIRLPIMYEKKAGIEGSDEGPL